MSLLLLLGSLTLADNSPFDLTGPPIQVKVARKGVTLPISEVPNLVEGDRLYIHPDLPEDQAAHYLLVVTFLRGSTNPPPEQWFIKAECWNKKFRAEGIFVTVPVGAQQAVIFLAPETTGDFNTLRSAVRGRPGSFVRAVQDLDQASLDRARLDTYLKDIHNVADDDPAKVHDVSVLLARSLNIHLEEDCFKKPVDEQASCLTQKSGDLVLNDGHSQSMVGALTNGPASDLIGQLTYTPQAGSGYFSPYVGAIVDMGRILDSLHTAQYQYIPALSLPKKDMLELKLNNPPSFHNPKSVIVVALPSVRKEEEPPLRAANANFGVCVQKDPLVLPTLGAPLAFATSLLHDVTLHVDSKNGAVDLPLAADPERGGFVVDAAALAKAKLENQSNSKGTLKGQWGFDAFTGPNFSLVQSKDTKWAVPSAESSKLMAGSALTLHLNSPEAACVDRITLKTADGDELKSTWKVEKADQVAVSIPADSTKDSGAFLLDIKQTGLSGDATVPLRIYGKAAELSTFSIIPGDSSGVLRGSGANQVASLDLKGAQFKPDPTAANTNGQARLVSSNSSVASALKPGDKATARATLNDGRTLDVPVSVEAPRPRIKLLSKAVELGSVSSASVIHLTNQNQLPLDAQLSFALKSEQPATFPRTEKIEIATGDESFRVALSTSDGSLTLQDPKTVVGRFNPAKSFGPSAFGPLQFRAVNEDGVNGDWQPLAKLVREPVLEQLDCPADASQSCTLKGNNLFLLESVAGDPQFTHPTPVPEGFLESTLTVPHPANNTLYIKLRDDPSDINSANVPAPPAPAATATASPHR